MKVLKFGGGCLNSVESIERLPLVLAKYKNDDIIIVVSAFQKTTNFLEQLVPSFDEGKFQDFKKLDKSISDLISYHSNIIMNLFNNQIDIEEFYDSLWQIFSSKIKTVLDFKNYLCKVIVSNQSDCNFYYDQIVSLGEILSSKIINMYLAYKNIENDFCDIRKIIITDSLYREGNVDWQLTKENMVGIMTTLPIVTQGFIAGNTKGETVTLGREGSDYSAAIIANAIGAEEVILFKDVDGVYDSDPKQNIKAKKHDYLSYVDAYKISIQGSTVIHPKTIKPVQEQNIILRIKNYNDINKLGTVIK